MQISRPSFDEVYAAYADMVYSLCVQYLRHTQDAEDAAQRVFVKVYKKLPSYRGDAQVKTWIYRIAINQCLDIIRSQKSRMRIDHGSAELVGTDWSHPGVLLEDQEAVKRIFDCIDQLPDTQKTALILKSIDRLSQQEIADVLEISIKAVESLLSRARSNLKKLLSNTKD